MMDLHDIIGQARDVKHNLLCEVELDDPKALQYYDLALMAIGQAIAYLRLAQLKG